MMSLMAFVNQVKAQNSLTVSINQIKNKSGNISIGIFNKKEGFLKEGFQLAKTKVRVADSSVSYTFKNLPKGYYAVAVFHDENSDNQCNLNFIGIPKESYGFSNNFRPKLSAPNFNQTKFFVDGNREIKINLIH